MRQKRFIVEMTIDGSVRPVEVMAENREDAKDKAEAKYPYPEATRTWLAYTPSEWLKILRGEEPTTQPDRRARRAAMRRANARNRAR